jgi:ADP-ribose pyrophosphatase YjhB (NUDIX family)/predicted transcriptional regulator
MSTEISIHAAQTSILRELLFQPQAGYASLQKLTNLTSDHFNFHIARLIELGLVEKVARGQYKLAPKGKEYANKLDTDTNTIERQPKVSVVLLVERKRDGKTEYLCQERLKNPYYGYWGRMTGKIRWGESVAEAASRELLEETGLTADFTCRLVYHKRDYKTETNELLEDKLFFIMHTDSASGTLQEECEGGRNAWMTEEKLAAQSKHFSSALEFVELFKSGQPFVEREFHYSADEY